MADPTALPLANRKLSYGRYLKSSASPLPTEKVPRVFCDVASVRLIKDKDGVPAALVRQCCNAKMCAWQARVTGHCESIAIPIQNCCVLCSPRDIIAVDHVGVGHLGIEIVRISQRCGWVDVVDRDLRSVGPLIDWMRSVAGEAGVSIFPPELDSVLHVHHHNISHSTRSPAVASYASMSVVVLPCRLISPGFVSGSPTILLECGIIGGVPHVHTDITRVVSTRS